MKAIAAILLFLVEKSFSVPPPNSYENITSFFFSEMVPEVALQIIRVYEGATARLPCILETDRNQKSFWMYAKTSLETFTPITMQDRGRITMEEDGNMTIYHVTESNAGVYTCRNINSIGSVIILEIIDDENYSESDEHTPIVLVMKQRLVVYTLWSQWSGCSECGRVGRKRRFGICYVKSKENNHNSSTNDVFVLFKDGIPCRSPYLLNEISQLTAVRNRSNEITIAECQVPCIHIIFESSLNGTMIERANNSAGLYSLMQPLPAQPPPPVRDILFAVRGQTIVVKCLGTTLDDVPIRWRVGTKWLKTGGGRFYVDARDHVIIKRVANEDANIYSCWERDKLAGTVKLFVWEGEHMRWNHHSTMIVLVLLFGFILRVLFIISQRTR